MTKTIIKQELRDYFFIMIGLMMCAFGWSAFLIPNKIASGGLTGASAVIFYATGFPIEYSYFIINLFLIVLSFKFLGVRFSIRTLIASFSLTIFFGLFQRLFQGVNLLGENEVFMSSIIGSALCGIGLGIVFVNNGCTGGTDIIASIINKYKNISLGRLMLFCDIGIVTSGYFISHNFRTVIFGYVTLVIISYFIDWIINSARQSVQYLIFTPKYQEMSNRVMKEVNRGITIVDGMGWYSKQEVKIMIVVVNRRQSVKIFRLIKEIDPHAFISESAVRGVYGEGFNKIKS